MGMIDKIKQDDETLRDIDVKLICGKDKTHEECEDNYKYNTTARLNNFILDQLCNITKEEPGITNAQLIVGQDREKSYGFLSNWFERNNIKLNEDENLNRSISSSLVRPIADPSLMDAYINDDSVDVPVEYMSGTLMRELVKNDKQAKFKNLVQKTGLTSMAAEELFDEIKYNLQSVETKRRKIKGGKTNKTKKYKKTPRNNKKKSKKYNKKTYSKNKRCTRK
jgi:hypothetical protein